MQIKINGASRALEDALTVQKMAQLLDLNPTQVAIECNGAIVSRGNWESHSLHDGDEVEIVQFIGGG